MALNSSSASHVLLPVSARTSASFLVAWIPNLNHSRLHLPHLLQFIHYPLLLTSNFQIFPQACLTFLHPHSLLPGVSPPSPSPGFLSSLSACHFSACLAHSFQSQFLLCAAKVLFLIYRCKHSTFLPKTIQSYPITLKKNWFFLFEKIFIEV